LSTLSPRYRNNQRVTSIIASCAGALVAKPGEGGTALRTAGHLVDHALLEHVGRDYRDDEIAVKCEQVRSAE
jgi:hypothetical protein